VARRNRAMGAKPPWPSAPAPRVPSGASVPLPVALARHPAGTGLCALIRPVRLVPRSRPRRPPRNPNQAAERRPRRERGRGGATTATSFRLCLSTPATAQDRPWRPNENREKGKSNETRKHHPCLEGRGLPLEPDGRRAGASAREPGRSP